MAVGVQITFDAHDPDALARFWMDVLGYVSPPPPEGFETWQDWASAMGMPEEDWNNASAIEDPDGVGPRIFIQKVPESKTAKNRMHLDVAVSGGRGVSIEERKARIDTEADRLEALGATIVGPLAERDEYWVVMQDPEGNEFCLH